MKYLKSFNENTIAKLDAIEFCKNSLIYLIDEGFEITELSERMYGSTDVTNDDINRIWLFKKVNGKKSYFRWDDIKDDYIPFLQLLAEKYTILKYDDLKRENPTIKFRIKNTDYNLSNGLSNKSKNYSLVSVLNDDIFETQGYWKDQIFYSWIPDPDILGISVAFI